MIARLHNWNLTPQEAMRIQTEFRERLVLRWDDRPVSTVGGVDVSIQGEFTRAAIVVLGYPDLTPIEAAVEPTPLAFPYIPGLLAFREGPAILAAWNQLKNKPDLLLFDGQGIASHMGLWLERPTIGVAKSRLYELHGDVGLKRGDRADLLDKNGNVIGAVMRTRDRTNPLYISPGHLMDIAHAVEFVMACSTGYRLPEPTRWAHKVAGGEQLPGQDKTQPTLF